LRLLNRCRERRGIGGVDFMYIMTYLFLCQFVFPILS
jgi:hypothetical protein